MSLPVVSRTAYQTDVVDASHAQPVLVDFWGPACGPCVAMLPWVEQLAARNEPALKVVKVDSKQDRRLCMDLQILGLPTFALYRDGVEVWRLTGDACAPANLLARLHGEIPTLDHA